MKDVSIHALGPQHAPEICRLEQQIFGSDAWSEPLVLEELTSPWSSYLGVFAQGQTGTQLIGYGGVKGDLEADLMTIGLVNGWRGKGLGRRLLQALVDVAADRGVRKLFLEVRESNRRARKMYQRAGFLEVGKTPGYYRFPTEAAVTMVRDLKETTGSPGQGRSIP